MLDYQSLICPKCGKAVFRTEDTKYCQYCGAKLPELKELPKITCPMCHGKGEIDARGTQPFNPTIQYFNAIANEEKKE